VTSDLSCVATAIPSRGRLHSLGLCWQNLLNHRNVHPTGRILILASKTYQIDRPWKQADFCFVQTEHWNQGMAYSACADLWLRYEGWKYLLIVEDDSRCFPNHAQLLLEAMEANPTIGMLTMMGGWAGPIGSIRDTLQSYGHLLIRREALVAAGGFYHEMPLRAETEFAIRLYLAGYSFRALVHTTGPRHAKMTYGGAADTIGPPTESMEMRGREMARAIVSQDYRMNKWIRTNRYNGDIILYRKLIEEKVKDGSARRLLDSLLERRKARVGYTQADLDAATWL